MITKGSKILNHAQAMSLEARTFKIPVHCVLLVVVMVVLLVIASGIDCNNVGNRYNGNGGN